MKRIFWVFFVVLLLFLVTVGLSPYIELYQAKKAHDKGDFKPILAMVDYPKVQADVTATLTERLDETLANKKELVFLQSIAPEMVSQARTKMNDKIQKTTTKAITEDNLEKLLTGQVSDDSRTLGFLWAVASDYVDYEMLFKDAVSADLTKIMAGQEAAIYKKVIERFGKPVPTKPVANYCGLNCFYVQGSLSGQPVGLICIVMGCLIGKYTK